MLISLRSKLFLVLVIFIIMIVLVSCKIDLHNDLDESEINEMLAILLNENLSADKISIGKDKWKLVVEEKYFADAVETLELHGYPKKSYKSMGDIFKGDRLVSSPAEEHVRYIYALSQELAYTISQIDGVLSARIHISIPNNDPLDDNKLPSSASIFIKSNIDSKISSLIPQIKQLVVNSIEGLDYEKVSAIVIRSKKSLMPIKKHNEALVYFMGLKVAPASVFPLQMSVVTLIVFIIIVIAGTYWFYNKKKVAEKISGENDKVS